MKISNNDVITVVTGGDVLFEVLEAYEKLKNDGINIRVVDCFSVKPFDNLLMEKCAIETNGLVYVVEDHYQNGGLGGAVSYSLKQFPNARVHHRAVTNIPRSGTTEELFDLFGLSASKIYDEILSILKGSSS